MVMNNPQLVLWHEPVRPPLDPEKTVHVKNHWRRPPNSSPSAKNNNAEQSLRIVVKQPGEG